MIDHVGEILILTGPPGSGKTTTGEALAQLPGSPKVHLHSDFFWGFIKHGLIPPWLPEAQAQNDVVIRAFAQTAKIYAQGGYFVVLDGIVGPWFLHRFRELDVPLHYVVLRGPLDVAIQRCQARGGDTLADPGPIADLHRQFSNLGDLERHALPIDGLSKADTLRRVGEALESNSFRLV